MISILASSLILGKPLMFYLGLLTYISLLLTAAIAILNLKFKIHIIPLKVHPVMAATTIILATVHAILGMSLYFNF